MVRLASLSNRLVIHYSVPYNAEIWVKVDDGVHFFWLCQFMT